jgi:uncharacterized protein
LKQQEDLMLWQGRRESDNVEDRRGLGMGTIAGGGGIVTVIIIVISLLTGTDPTQLLQQVNPSGPTAQVQPAQVNPQQEPLRQFVGVVLADTEDVWNQLFRDQIRKPYVQPKLVIFSDQVQSACGYASAASGPFYCPADQKVYIDLTFYDLMKQRFKAPGDFAMAYVIAHEVGHHVQRQLGFTAAQGDNEASVRLELQADYLAGVWAHHAQRMKNILEAGDIDEALNAANAIGDDTLQKRSQGHVVPDSFTHGTSAQRARWFKRGFETGNVAGMAALFKLPYGQL